MNDVDNLPIITDELALMSEMIALERLEIIELGCGNARIAREMLSRFPGTRLTGVETDAVQHIKNLETPQLGLTFLEAGAQSIPAASASFDMAFMLKSLHHIPLNLMATALNEIARVVRQGGYLYVSEPIYDGDLNEIVKLYNDEGVVRAAAQNALNEAVIDAQYWEQLGERRFAMAVSWRNFEEFEQRMMRPTYSDHHLTDEKIAAVRKAFEARVKLKGPNFVRPMHVRLLGRLPTIHTDRADRS